MASIILESFKLESQWPTFDPFLFCAHHRDDYPSGNSSLGPDASLATHSIGQDFEHPDGWNMYHGTDVPGFPQHPHRGFETISYLRSGTMDHADSLGATARFGAGDVQWMTTGKGIQHSEMFPLTSQGSPNPLELFQIWLNLPSADKMVDPYFTMFWNEDLPRHTETDQNGRETTVVVLAGSLGQTRAPRPPANSWAARPESDLAIWHVKLDPHATWTMPAARAESVRSIYLFDGGGMQLGGEHLGEGYGARVEASGEVLVQAGGAGSEFLVMQGRPIGEPVARYGPFVMTTDEEIRQAIADYQQTQFGAWPWPNSAPNHGATKGRFAVHGDGRVEGPASQLAVTPK